MKDFHRRLAEISLRVLEEYGFVLAGGYAISAHGIGDRPSFDVDLFTSNADQGRFDLAITALRRALDAAGLMVTDKRVRPLFVDIEVADPNTGERSDLQLGMNYREFPPHRINIGPVLDVRDAVAAKMSALWSRGEARDFIDIAAVLESGRFSAAEILALADEQEATPMERQLLVQQFGAAARWSKAEYARYGVDAAGRERIIARFAAWATELGEASRDAT
ncbi:MAG: nucleotidyl transferase AbiEii/AbiGii toxin family protein [Arachnia sp.]